MTDKDIADFFAKFPPEPPSPVVSAFMDHMLSSVVQGIAMPSNMILSRDELIAEFDAKTNAGMRLNLLTGQYYKPTTSPPDSVQQKAKL